MTSEVWLKIHCPACKQINWIYGGSSDDDGTEYREDAFECWSCHTKHWFDEEMAEAEHYWELKGPEQEEDCDDPESLRTLAEILEEEYAVLGKIQPT